MRQMSSIHPCKPTSAAVGGSLILSFILLISAHVAAVAAETVLLEWDDLLPEGELESLIEQYDDYVEELERQLMQSRNTLSGSDLNVEIEEGSSFDVMPQLGTFRTVDALNGKDIRIPGYVVPFDFSEENKYSEFLFVPYFGACIHVPPPPPNQILYVTANAPVAIEELWKPFYVQGVLTTQKNVNDLGSAAYTLRLQSIEEYAE